MQKSVTTEEPIKFDVGKQECKFFQQQKNKNGEIWERLRSNLAGFLTNSIYLNKIHHYWEVYTTREFF